jgi:hypothetical protein
MTIIRFSDEAKNIYDFLVEQAKRYKAERMILDSLKDKLALIQGNSHYGDSIAKRLIPRYYVVKFGIKNLFRVELSQYWRMLYSLTKGEEVEVIALIIDIQDHEGYDKAFGYKGK